MEAGKKICLLSIYDYAGSGYRLAEAIGTTTNNHVEYMVMLPVGGFAQFPRYPTIYKGAKDGGHTITTDDISRVRELIKRCDIVHIKSDFLPDNDVLKPFNIGGKKKIITVCGSHFRVGNTNWARGKGDFTKYLEQTDLRTAMNPDLNYPEFDSTYVPFPYESDKFNYMWEKREIPVIAHSPSTKSKKGTQMFLDALEIVEKQGIKFELNLIEGVTHEQCLKRKAKATIFFDQALVGSYGNSAVEAMAFGIPTMCYLPEKSIEQSSGRLRDCPVMNCGNTTESIAKAIISMLGEDLKELSLRTKEWCDNEHGYENIGKVWNDIYKRLQ